MTLLILVLVIGTGVALLYRRYQASPAAAMSTRWLKEHHHRDDRVDFYGPTWLWPINKDVNENGAGNRSLLSIAAVDRTPV